MKTARQRAEDAYNARQGNPRDAIAVIEHMFREYARDQRHLCAERVQAEFALCRVPPKAADSVAHAAVMNTPYPGESR